MLLYRGEDQPILDHLDPDPHFAVPDPDTDPELFHYVRRGNEWD